MSQVLLAAFDIVLIETVGVGQQEVDISRMCDTTCYVAQPGSGDSVQFLKAGILEVPHILVVNKADMGAVARRTLAELGAALHREHPDGHWQVPVLATSATNGTGIEALADMHCNNTVTSSSRATSWHPDGAAIRPTGYTSACRRSSAVLVSTSSAGNKPLLAQLQAQDLNLLEHYESLRQRLYNRYDGSSE